MRSHKASDRKRKVVSAFDSRIDSNATTVETPPEDEDWFHGDISRLKPHNNIAKVAFHRQAEKTNTNKGIDHFLRLSPLRETTRRGDQEPSCDPTSADDSDSDSDEEIDRKPAVPLIEGYWPLNFDRDEANSTRISFGRSCNPEDQGPEALAHIPLTSSSNEGVRRRHGYFSLSLKDGLLSITCIGKQEVICSSDHVRIKNRSFTFPTTIDVQFLCIGDHIYMLEHMPWTPAGFIAHLDVLRSSLDFKGDVTPHLIGTYASGHQQVQGYVTQKHLGQGSQGLIKCGYSVHSGAAIAFKIVSTFVNREELTQKEVQITKMLDHPNVIRLVETINQDAESRSGSTCLVLQPLCHSSLAELPHGFAINHCLDFVAQGCFALEYIHNRLGVMHRDIKPGNVLYRFVGDSVQLVITDFGHAANEKQSNNHRRGTTTYLAPEVIDIKRESKMTGRDSERTYDQKVDIWSWGLLVGNLATDKNLSNLVPPTGVTQDARIQILKRVRQSRRFSGDWLSMIERMLAWNPDDRPSADQLVKFVQKKGYKDPQSPESSKREIKEVDGVEEHGSKKTLLANGNAAVTESADQDRSNIAQRNGNAAPANTHQRRDYANRSLIAQLNGNAAPANTHQRSDRANRAPIAQLNGNTVPANTHQRSNHAKQPSHPGVGTKDVGKDGPQRISDSLTSLSIKTEDDMSEEDSLFLLREPRSSDFASD